MKVRFTSYVKEIKLFCEVVQRLGVGKSIKFFIEITEQAKHKMADFQTNIFNDQDVLSVHYDTKFSSIL